MRCSTAYDPSAATLAILHRFYNKCWFKQYNSRRNVQCDSGRARCDCSVCQALNKQNYYMDKIKLYTKLHRIAVDGFDEIESESESSVSFSTI